VKEDPIIQLVEAVNSTDFTRRSISDICSMVENYSGSYRNAAEILLIGLCSLARIRRAGMPEVLPGEKIYDNLAPCVLRDDVVVCWAGGGAHRFGTAPGEKSNPEMQDTDWCLITLVPMWCEDEGDDRVVFHRFNCDCSFDE
jgi:hypothetical protein